MEMSPGAEPQTPMQQVVSEPGDPTTYVRRSGRRIPVLLTAACTTALVALGTWCTYWADLRNDQYQLINLGQCIYDGGRLYIDCWENKPPGIAWFNTLGIVLSGGGQLGVWLLPGLVTLLAIALAGYAAAQVLSRAAACCMMLIATVVCTLRLYDAPSINPDCYSSMLELAACSLWVMSLVATSRLRRVLFGLVAGLMWAAAATVRQTGLVGLMVVSLVVLVVTVVRRGDRGRWLAAGGFAWIGFVMGAAAVIAVLLYRRTLGEAWQAIFVFNRGLLSLDSIGGAVGEWRRIRAGLEPLQLPLWLGLVGVVAMLCPGRDNRLSLYDRARSYNNTGSAAPRGLKPAAQDRGGIARYRLTFTGAVLLWWIVQVLLALIGPSRSMRYWQATFPPMLILAAAGFYHLETMFRQSQKGHRITLAAVCATVVILLGRPLADHYMHGVAGSYLAYHQEQTERDRLAAMGREIQAVVPPGRSIYVWAYDAGVYLYASRRPASRFTYPRSAGQIREILSDLADGKAYALLIPKGVSPEFERWCDDECHQVLTEILEQYEGDTEIGPYQVWIRRFEK